MILIGELSLWVALLMATWAATVSFAGGAQRRLDLIASGERAIYAALAMLILASLGVWTALVTHDFSLAHAASFTSANLPLLYTLSALWSGPAGSLLLWALVLAACSAVAVRTDRDDTSAPYVTGTLAVVLAFSLAALCLGANPYERLDIIPLDGSGMHPALQSAGMTLHPPALYLGLAAAAVPFALAVAALITRGEHVGRTTTLRRWALVSWIFLTVGIVLGMRWAYLEAGWSETWVRDAADNASLFPWLVNTVLLHSLVAQEDGSEARQWNAALALSVFLLSIYSAFVARGGIISLAHSFAGSPVADWAAGFLVIVSAACVFLVTTRAVTLRSRPEPTDSGHRGPWWRPARSTLRRRLGAHVAHAGLVVLLVAITGQAFRNDHTVTLGAGESTELRDPFGRAWRFTSQGISQYNEINRRVVAAAVDVTRDGASLGIATSELRQYVNSRGSPTFEPATQAGMLGSLTQDVRISLEEVGAAESVRLRVSFHPLAVLVWIAGGIMAAGGVIALAASRRTAG